MKILNLGLLLFGLWESKMVKRTVNSNFYHAAISTFFNQNSIEFYVEKKGVEFHSE